MTTISVPCLIVGQPTVNGRIYPEPTVIQAISSFNIHAKQNRVLGIMRHAGFVDIADVGVSDAAFLVKYLRLRKRDMHVIATIRFLVTPKGMELKQIRCTHVVAYTTRCTGTICGNVVQPDLQIVSVDAIPTEELLPPYAPDLKKKKKKKRKTCNSGMCDGNLATIGGLCDRCYERTLDDDMAGNR